MPVTLSLLIIAAVASLALLFCLRLILVTRRLNKDVEQLRQQLGSVNHTLKTKASFSESLTQVERQAAPAADSPGSTADKYRYVAALTAQGVNAAGIAAALQMPPAEVEQLMRLSRLKHQSSGSED